MFINPETLLNLAVKAIDKRQSPGNEPCVMYVCDNQIVCLPPKADRDGLHFVRRFTIKELTEGLTSIQWWNISVRLSQIFNKGYEIQPPQQQ